ncbi:hypothetical protein evm_001176 [Chilo suppressalis]|nr:hypothetical protein evm_001176 [Chilo suppressalis]
MERAESGYELAQNIMEYYSDMFNECIDVASPSQQFLSDNLQSFVNYPSKTTVGIAPKFTSNRKFLANLLSTTAFKKMLAADEEELTKEFVRKLRYCDATIMDQGTYGTLHCAWHDTQ